MQQFHFTVISISQFGIGNKRMGTHHHVDARLMRIAYKLQHIRKSLGLDGITAIRTPFENGQCWAYESLFTGKKPNEGVGSRI